MANNTKPGTQVTSAQETPQSGTSSQTQTGNPELEARKRALNEVFGLLKLGYHNQFNAAFPDVQTLNHAKRLWLESLAGFSPEEMVAGAKRAIKQSEYLPTVHKMLQFCAEGDNGLPDPRAAYREACNAPSPKANHKWSHPAVYHAGRAADWFFLANNPESSAYPVFASHYKKICERLMAGENLPAPSQTQLEHQPSKPLSKAENAKKLAELRAQLKI
ncbi:replication protein P [Microbulbifer harenosus]|uniref:replication protein P n=1 Tax=Microbulbifer harenosus TaxID=2576840 RepID=UPI001FE73291|nr:replication protein P [Microbulbifer harenosus]